MDVFPTWDKRAYIASIVADDAATSCEFAADHALNFLIVIATVCTGRDEDSHVLEPGTGHLGKEGLKHGLSGLSACDVTYRNSDSLTRLDELFQTAFSDGGTYRIPQCVRGIRHWRDVDRFDHCRMIGKISNKTGRA